MRTIVEILDWWSAFYATPVPLALATLMSVACFFIGEATGDSSGCQSRYDKKLIEQARKRQAELEYDEAYCHYMFIGYLAYESGDSRDENPYATGYLPNDAWDDGWCARAYQKANPR